MTTFRYSFRPKQFAIFSMLILTASSLFAFFVPEIFVIEEKNEIEIESAFLFAHPLSGISDNVLICSDDGSELHEIFLCGANAQRLLTTNIPNLKQIIWSKLQEGSCSPAQLNCANTSPTCTWNQVSTNTQYNISAGGQYRIYVQYNDNSSERFYFNVYANGLDPSAVVTNIDCGTSGSITINNVPSTYEYSINSGATWQDSNVFSISSVSDYDVQIRRKNDTDGCVFILDNLAVGNNSIDATTTVLPISCNAAQGGIQVDINNASSTYVFKISQGGSLINSSGPVTSNSYTFPNLGAGTYDIEVTLASVSNCTYNAIETIPGFVNIQPNVVVTKNIDCTDGIITVSPTGGNPPFEYSLDNGGSYLPFNSGNQTTIAAGTAGAYTINLRDANGCEVDASPVNITTETEITYTVIPKDISCNGTDDGSLTVDVTDTQGYSITYSIDGGGSFQTSNVFSNLTAGSYTAIIRKEKAGGTCDITANPVDINTGPAFTASAAVTQQIDCTNGSATITASVTAGGTAPFEYSLNGVDFQSSAALTGLGAGDYTITIKDALGCTTTVDQAVSAGSNPSDLTFITSNVDCSTGATDVQVAVQNGEAPFTFRITAPTVINAPGDTFNGLLPNTYTFEVTADDGCKIVRNFIVPNPIQFTTNVLVKNNVSCAAAGTSDGSIEVSVNNFDTSFSIDVVDGAGLPTGYGVYGATSSPATISNLWADTYTLYITDISGTCQKVETVTVSGPPSPLTVDSFSIGSMNCGMPGSVTIEASGGWGSYTYAVQQPDNTITPSQSNKTITGLSQPGTHTIRVTDVNGCLLDTTTFNLTDQGGPTSTVDIASSNYCYSTATKGELKIDVTAGEAPYFYSVNNGTPLPITGGTFTLSNLTPDEYIVKVIGNNGCETIVADTKISGQLFALAQITKPLGCGATPDAIIEVTPEEGYPPYTYRVDSGSGYSTATVPFNAGAAGSYTFEVTDAKGCIFTTDPVNVVLSPALTSSHSVSDTACGKDGTGSIELIANGGTPPYLYSFDGSPFTSKTIYSNLDATTYNYSIRDALGCELTGVQAIIGAESAITAEIEKTDIQCDPVAGGNVWGNIKVKNIQNSTSPVTISLVRVRDRVKYEAGDETRTWTYRRYENIDLATNSNYNSASKPALYGTNTGFDIRMYWAHHFVVRIEDDKGCLWESAVYTIDSPPIPSGVTSPVALQTCANGATYDFSITNIDSDNDGTPDLEGPFEVRLYPYQLIDDDGDGIEDDVNSGWRPFDDAENPLYDPLDPENERDYRFTNSALYGKLLFGVAYSVAIRDLNTGCVRWRSLRPIVQPPTGFITVDAVPQSETCRNAQDGEVQLTIENYAPGNVDIKIYNAGRPANTAFHYNQSVSGTGAPLTLNIPNMRVAWYVVEVEDSSGCTAGERFLIYRPKAKLQIELEQYVPANCHVGAQIAVNATGGWDNQTYFNRRNKLDQTSWHPYEYAYVVDGTDPATLPASAWSADTYQEITPSAYDGTNNIYQVYVRDGSGCIAELGTPVTITQDAIPAIDKVDVTNRCTSTNEIYDVVATLTNPGTNPVDGAPKYIWDGEVTTTPNKQLGPGNHTLEIRDENGCSVSQNIFIYPQLVAQSKITKTVDCDTSNTDNGEMLASAYGGSGTFQFTINPIPASYAPGEETNTTGIFDRLAAGVNYVYTVTDIDPQILPAERCPTQDTPPLQLTVPVAPDFIVESKESVTCNGANDGKIIIGRNPTADNLDVAYEYRIDGGAYQSSNVFEGLTPGLHDVDIRSSKNCIQSLTGIAISEPTLLQLSTPTVSLFTCTSDNNLGMATITVSAGATGKAPYVYSFNGSSFTNSTTYDIPYLTTARIVTIDVIDANNCTDQTTVNVPAATKVTASIVRVSSGPMNCVDNEIINVVGADGTGIPNYEVRELPSGNLINGTGHGSIDLGAGNPGTYVFELTDTVTRCTAQVVHTIAPFDTIEVVGAKLNDIYCFGGSDGGIEFTVSGYSGAFDYEIYNTNAPTVSVVNGSDNTSSGSTSVTTLPVGTYFVEVRATDVPKCAAVTDHITIQSPVKVMDFTFGQTQELTCIPGNDAQITATPDGGWGGYEFRLIDTASPGTPIQDFDPNNVFSGLTSGINYEITLRDLRGCANVTKPFTISPIDLITIDPATISVTNTDCPGADNGSISVVATRLNGPTAYQFILDNVTTGISSVPQTSNTFTGLVQGDYTVTVIDGYGCDATTATLSITDPPILEIDAAITQEPNCTPNSGEITVSATGGSGAYEFSIVSPAAHVTGWSTQTVYPALASAKYEFSVRDLATPTCISPLTVIRTINVVEPLEVTVDDNNTIINCNGESDAVLIATAIGGLGEYQYQLELNGTLTGAVQNSGIFENLGPGTYRIRATGAGNCEDYNDTPIIIDEPPVLSATLGTVQNVQCFGELNGSITVNSQGGVAPHQYIISSQPQKAQNSNVFEGLDGGTYSVIVQDANGCEFLLDNITVVVPTAALAINVARVDDEECSTDDNGLIELNISGGTTPYEYNLTGLNDPSTTISGSNLLLDNLDGGFYNIYITDANGCYDVLVQEVKVGVDLTASYETLYECKDGVPYQTTTVTLENEELNSEVLYALDSENPAAAQTSPVFENIAPGMHYISIIHQGGCIEKLNTIEVEAIIPLTLTSLDGTFNEILVEANGGDGNYTYYFEDTPSRTGSYFINKDGNYLVRVVDGKGCEASVQVPMEFIDIEIPNFFTPDGDGYKDKWIIKNTEAFPDIYVRIYDRYGRTIKEFIGQGEWDGSYNKVDLPTGDYWYVIKLNGPNDRREFVGNVTVYR
ncbi:T9SS type B sorting domain-containing protein [Maribacter algarum]|uniref:T9SS type B sorting domain-containing protein n=1 Tax=Maribacter algarum (ex Zhang et al. 2020) TaxID=2578118 RepID=A0A5S3PW70_9FLAO|nr:T9SS type B sorting domain-containing protein [Maribacter algarum]TMM59266.1 T9SS type B sorting domain-containing protein [Maribacter algarum]